MQHDEPYHGMPRQRTDSAFEDQDLDVVSGVILSSGNGTRNLKGARTTCSKTDGLRDRVGKIDWTEVDAA